MHFFSCPKLFKLCFGTFSWLNMWKKICMEIDQLKFVYILTLNLFSFVKKNLRFIDLLHYGLWLRTNNDFLCFRRTFLLVRFMRTNCFWILFRSVFFAVDNFFMFFELFHVKICMYVCLAIEYFFPLRYFRSYVFS